MNPKPFFLALTDFNTDIGNKKIWVAFGWNPIHQAFIPIESSKEECGIAAFSELRHIINEHLSGIKVDLVKEFKPSYLLI